MSVLSIPGIIRGGQVEKYGEAGRAWTCTVAAGQTATGGLLLEGAAGDRVVRTAQAGSFVVVGMAVHDQAAGLQVVNAAEGVWFLTPTAATIASGAKAVPAATGAVVAAGVTPDARTIVARAIADISASTPGPFKLTV
jgi:hypothetical protein